MTATEVIEKIGITNAEYQNFMRDVLERKPLGRGNRYTPTEKEILVMEIYFNSLKGNLRASTRIAKILLKTQLRGDHVVLPLNNYTTARIELPPYGAK